MIASINEYEMGRSAMAQLSLQFRFDAKKLERGMFGIFGWRRLFGESFIKLGAWILCMADPEFIQDQPSTGSKQ